MNSTQKSERVMAMILARLLENGVQDGEMDEDRLGLTDELRPYFGQCFKWLIREGLVSAGSFRSTNSGSFAVDPVLTARGYELLGRKFAIDGRDVSAAQIVNEKSKDATSYTGLGDFLGGVLGGFTKSIGS